MTRPTFENLALLAASLAISLVAVEIAGQSLRDGTPDARMLLFSENPWVFDEGGFVKFKPRSEIRTAALYGDTIEYDVWFRTNDEGFVDDTDYASLALGEGRRNIAVVGDSFTAGFHGGAPWVQTLRSAPGFDPRTHNLFNFGVSGTGLLSWDRLLATYVDRFARNEILLVTITSDLSRALWRPVTDGDAIILCDRIEAPDECRGQTMRIYEFPRDATGVQMRELARQKHAPQDSWWARFKARSFLLGIVRELRNRMQASAGNQVGFETLASLREAFPDATIKLLHVPQKKEVAAGGFDGIRQQVEDLGIEYHDGSEVCGLTTDDFHELDGHPNQSGYGKIRRCALQALELGSPRGAETARGARPQSR